MGTVRFRQLADRMDTLLVLRLGDRAILADGSDLFGAFASGFMGDAMSGGSHKIGGVSDPDEVRQPTLTVRAVEAVKAPKGAYLTVDLPVALGGGAHVVVRQEPDGHGMVDLKLRPSNERAERTA